LVLLLLAGVLARSTFMDRSMTLVLSGGMARA